MLPEGAGEWVRAFVEPKSVAALRRPAACRAGARRGPCRSRRHGPASCRPPRALRAPRRPRRPSRRGAPSPARFAALCDELAAHGIGDSVQHDDLHMGNVADRDLRVIDWGDASVARPFFSLVVMFRFLELELPPGDPWFARLRDAYLEPWGSDARAAFDLAQRVGWVAHAAGWTRILDHTPPEQRAMFDAYPAILARAFAGIDG